MKTKIAIALWSSLLIFSGCATSYKRREAVISVVIPESPYQIMNQTSAAKPYFSQIPEEAALALLSDSDKKIFRIIREFEIKYKFRPFYHDFSSGRLTYNSLKHDSSEFKNHGGVYSLLVDWSQRRIRICHLQDGGSAEIVEVLSLDLQNRIQSAFGSESAKRVIDTISVRLPLFDPA